jgi:hypothetical protein
MVKYLKTKDRTDCVWCGRRDWLSLILTYASNPTAGGDYYYRRGRNYWQQQLLTRQSRRAHLFDWSTDCAFAYSRHKCNAAIAKTAMIFA